MYKDKYCIGMIYDRSFNIRDVRIAINIIGNIIYPHMNKAYYIYGGIPRFEFHTEQFCRDLKLDKSLFKKLEIPYTDDKYLTSTALKNWPITLLEYNPDEIHILRDDGHTNDTSTLVEYAIRKNIKVMVYNNQGFSYEVPYGDALNCKYGNKGKFFY